MVEVATRRVGAYSSELKEMKKVFEVGIDEFKNIALERINDADHALWGIFSDVVQHLKKTGFHKGTIREQFNTFLRND